MNDSFIKIHLLKCGIDVWQGATSTCDHVCMSRQLRAGNHTHSNRHSHTNNLHLAPNLRTCRGQRKKSYSDRNSQRDPELPVAAACRPAWMNKGEKFV